MSFIETIFLRLSALVVSGLEALGLPGWVSVLVAMLLPAVAVVAIYPAFFAFLTWLERKVLSRIQNRIGPNRVGPWGLLQPVADGMKMLGKEDIIPRAADKLLHTLAPLLIVVPAIMLFSLLPFGRDMVPADIDVSVLMFFAISSITTLGLFLAGWSSRNKYSILGAMRAIAQMISYEIPLLVAAVPAVMIAGSMGVSAIVAAQGPEGDAIFFGTFSSWFLWKPWGFVGFLAFFVAGMAELNRSPFDIAEGESEIIAGFHTEYSGMKFALFFLGEYLGAIAFSGLAATLYLGGWWGPAFLPSWLWFFLKMLTLLSLMIWIRGTFPRLRADQLMAFSWKFLLPLAFANIVATGVWFIIPRDTLLGSAGAWVASALLLVPAYVFLVRLNSGPAHKKRVYRYASFDPPAPPPSPSSPASPAATPTAEAG
jgi:NADH-quinone oxidoreductase subunit H